MKSLNTLTTATITWESSGNDVIYTVFSSSAGVPFSATIQTSFTLHDLEVETDYVVSVTATNGCGVESSPSEEITVRIDVQGIMHACVHKIILFIVAQQTLDRCVVSLHQGVHKTCLAHY